MATNNEPPKPPDGYATWLDTAMDWLGEFYDVSIRAPVRGRT